MSDGNIPCTELQGIVNNFDLVKHKHRVQVRTSRYVTTFVGIFYNIGADESVIQKSIKHVKTSETSSLIELWERCPRMMVLEPVMFS